MSIYNEQCLDHNFDCFLSAGRTYPCFLSFSRTFFFEILPVPVSGISSQKRTSSGIWNLLNLELKWSKILCFIACAASASFPLLSMQITMGLSSYRGWGTATTTAISTSSNVGCKIRTFLFFKTKPITTFFQKRGRVHTINNRFIHNKLYNYTMQCIVTNEAREQMRSPSHCPYPQEHWTSTLRPFRGQW